MNATTVYGPVLSEENAKDVMNSLGFKNHSVYFTVKPDSDGFTDFKAGVREYYVERLNHVSPDKIFGMSLSEIERMQGGRLR